MCRKFSVFLRQNLRQNIVQYISNKIINTLSKCGRGTIFFPSTFSHIAQPKTIDKTLERLVNDGVIIRIAHGIYCYPKIDKKLGLGVLYPTFDEIAKSIAKRDKTRIIPAGAYALNLLGLSTQVPMNVVYLTDGEKRMITIQNGRGILFKHAAPRVFAFSDSLAQLLTIALKEIGEKNITDEHKQKIKSIIMAHQPFPIADLRLMPRWIRVLITDLYD